MLTAVDKSHLDRRPPQRPGREQPRETAADDHHPAGTRCCGHGSPRPSVASYRLRALMVIVIAREPPGHHPDQGIAGTGARLARPSSLRWETPRAVQRRWWTGKSLTAADDG